MKEKTEIEWKQGCSMNDKAGQTNEEWNCRRVNEQEIEYMLKNRETISARLFIKFFRESIFARVFINSL